MSLEKGVSNKVGMPLHKVMDYVIELSLDSIRRNTRNNPKPYIVSTPGIGKTEYAEECAKSKGVGLLSFMMGLKTYDEVSCLPYIHTHNKNSNGVVIPTVEWIKAEFIEQICKEAKNHKELVVFFDDFHLCSSEIQKICNEIYTSHSLHGHKFPANVSFIAAGNDSTESGSSIILSTVMNRMIKLNTYPDREFWLENFAYPNNLDNIVTSYLARSIHDPQFCEPESNNPTGSPRSWTYLSNSIRILKNLGNTDYLNFKNVVDGCVSKVASDDFCLFYSHYSKVPIKEIFSGREFQYPNEVEKYAFIISVTDYIISELISVYEKYAFNMTLFPDEISILIKKVSIYSKLITRFVKNGDTELASISLFTLINHNYEMTINGENKTFYDLVRDLISTKVMDPGLLSLIDIQIQKKVNYIKSYASWN